ncbi:hypothetical protein O6H91_08G057500 [Diphasiastrum complanatum]|uniref:Uncharacterized protein n=1 Tax=Diphasiastrum complanatum TaxID=34168 RepID=A0ACC2CYX1_DIPCM|nr:hypothetical protein O6H91_08G057500 [Diphasiastrum complanatum]
MATRGAGRAGGGSNNSTAAWVERVDRLVDGSGRYSSALKSAFIHFQTLCPGPAIPQTLLLPALQYFLQKIVDELDSKAGKLCLRPISEEDLERVAQSDPSLDMQQPIDYEQFDKFARKMLKYVALDRGKRLGLFMLGGIVVVHMAKSTLGKIPFIGPPIGAVMSFLLPTAIAGPAVGVAGAMYM